MCVSVCITVSCCVSVSLCVSVVALGFIGNSQYRVCYLFLKVGLILAVVVALTSHRQQPPIYHWVCKIRWDIHWIATISGLRDTVHYHTIDVYQP